MRRYLAAALAAVLVVTAGCAGFTFDQTDATPTPVGDGEPAPEPAPRPVVTDGATTGVAPVEPGAATGMDAARAGQAEFAPSTAYGSLAAPGPSSTITVAGTGQAAADPELAVVSVVVQARAGTADAARGQVADDAARMRDALRDLGVPDDAVRTTYYHLSPQYDYSDERRELVGYVASHGFQIEAGVDDAGDVVDTAVGNGADQVQGVQFTLTDATQEELRREALTDAVENARLDADAIAAAAGVTITGVHSASTSGPVVTPVYGRVMAEAADAGTTFDTGPVTVSAYVSIAYTVE